MTRNIAGLDRWFGPLVWTAGPVARWFDRWLEAALERRDGVAGRRIADSKPGWAPARSAAKPGRAI